MPYRASAERPGCVGASAVTSYPIMTSTRCVAKPSAKVGALLPPLAMRLREEEFCRV
jgi:hypothetical protein